MQGSDNQDIAIVGMGGRFPGAENVHEFWRNLCDGVESVRFFSDEELLQSGVSPELLKLPNCVKAKAILDDIDMFDAPFFGFTPRDAEITDPQHRLFLECAWEALEDAGYDAANYEGEIGVYAGCGFSGYLGVILANRELFSSLGSNRIIMGNDKDFLSTLVSYKLGLRGPSVVVQTACSTSLVAVHIACQALLHGECDMALAGGVSIRLPQKSPYLFQEGGIHSPDGHCRAFDADAQGIVSGAGAAVVVVKRLAEALQDRDEIRAVIRASAINNDGSSKIGFTAPSIDGQMRVITEAIEMAQVDPETITYVEAHGTGTLLGDPLEVAALTRAFAASTDKKGFCALGSVKSNIGHLDAASGAAGLIKTVLALRNKQIPASLHFRRANPKIDFENSPFRVQSELSEWPGPHPRRAGVSSFGIGGTNAHLVLEEAPPREPSGGATPWRLIALSARTRPALEVVTDNLIRYLDEQADINVADVAYTLQVGRRPFEHRRILVCEDRTDALKALRSRDRTRLLTGIDRAKFRPVVFMFPGQGTQYVNMALDLYLHQPYFRGLIDLCADLLKPHLGLDIRDILYPGQESADEAGRMLDQTQITQPALFVVEYSLARLWMYWGVLPEAMIGHSLGEYVAACLSGVFTLEEALALVAARGRIVSAGPAGEMVAVRLTRDALLPMLNERLSLAAVNSPSQCVVAGPPDSMAELKRRLDAKSIRWRQLQMSHAMHSQLSDPVAAAFYDQLRKAQPRPPAAPYLSNVTGTWISGGEACSPDYWIRHLRETVRFDKGIAEILKEPDAMLLEVGPGQTLGALAAEQMDPQRQQSVLVSLPAFRSQAGAFASALHTLGSLWMAGVEVDWRRFHQDEQRNRVALPTYPFERARYWAQSPASGSPVASDHQTSNGPEAIPRVGIQAPAFSEIKPSETIVAEQTTTSQVAPAQAEHPAVTAPPQPVEPATFGVQPPTPSLLQGLTEAPGPQPAAPIVIAPVASDRPHHGNGSSLAEFYSHQFRVMSQQLDIMQQIMRQMNATLSGEPLEPPQFARDAVAVDPGAASEAPPVYGGERLKRQPHGQAAEPMDGFGRDAGARASHASMQAPASAGSDEMSPKA